MTNAFSEELALEAAGLDAIFGKDFKAEETTTGHVRWSVPLSHNGVELELAFLLDSAYPLDSEPQVRVTCKEGLSLRAVRELEGHLQKVAAENRGSPSAYLLYTAAQDWIDTHDRREAAEAISATIASTRLSAREPDSAATGTTFETKAESFTQLVEHETLEHATIDRTLGTPVTPETFAAWKQEFDKYLLENGILDIANNADIELDASQGGWKGNSRRKPTGRELFTMHREMFVDDFEESDQCESTASGACDTQGSELAEHVDASLFLS
jgi:hypothetical protein